MKKFPKLSFRLSSTFFGRLFAVIGIVLVWRGVWGLLDYYLLPEKPVLSYVFGLVIGLIVLYLPDEDIKELA